MSDAILVENGISRGGIHLERRGQRRFTGSWRRRFSELLDRGTVANRHGTRCRAAGAP